jgi:hypothetical protein
MHVELINPREKLSPELGGTGYVGPTEPASALSLYTNAEAAAQTGLDWTIWKLLRTKEHWRPKRLKLYGRSIPCEVIGGTGEWLFVSVVASKAAELMKKAALKS